MVKNTLAIQETWVRSLGWEDLLEKWQPMAHSSILSWRIPWTEEPGGLQSMRSRRVRHDWVTSIIPDIFLNCPCCRYFFIAEPGGVLPSSHSLSSEHGCLSPKVGCWGPIKCPGTKFHIAFLPPAEFKSSAGHSLHCVAQCATVLVLNIYVPFQKKIGPWLLYLAI